MIDIETDDLVLYFRIQSFERYNIATIGWNLTNLGLQYNCTYYNSDPPKHAKNSFLNVHRTLA